MFLDIPSKLNKNTALEIKKGSSSDYLKAKMILNAY